MTAVRPFDRIAVCLVGIAIVAAVFVSASRTLHTDPAGAFALPRSANPHGAFETGRREGVDPLKPPGLPEGVTIDPATGLLSGARLDAGPGERAVPWERLRPADGVEAASALPPAIDALAGETVVMAGFLMPLYELSAIREFLLVGSHYACCFGTPPGLGGMAMVRLAPGAAALQPMLEPLRVRGRFAIRERRRGPEPGEPLLLLFEIQDAEAAPLR